MKTKRNFLVLLTFCSNVIFAQGDSIEIVQASSLMVPANPPQKPNAFVTIYFTRNVAPMPAMHAENSSEAMAFAAVPFALMFEAKDEPYTVVKQGDDNGFEINVRPVKEDQ